MNPDLEWTYDYDYYGWIFNPWITVWREWDVYDFHFSDGTGGTVH